MQHFRVNIVFFTLKRSAEPSTTETKSHIFYFLLYITEQQGKRIKSMYSYILELILKRYETVHVAVQRRQTVTKQQIHLIKIKC